MYLRGNGHILFSEHAEMKGTETHKQKETDYFCTLFPSLLLLDVWLLRLTLSFQMLPETNPVIDFYFSPTDFR